MLFHELLSSEHGKSGATTPAAFADIAARLCKRGALRLILAFGLGLGSRFGLGLGAGLGLGLGHGFRPRIGPRPGQGFGARF